MPSRALPEMQPQAYAQQKGTSSGTYLYWASSGVLGRKRSAG